MLNWGFDDNLKIFNPSRSTRVGFPLVPVICIVKLSKHRFWFPVILVKHKAWIPSCSFCSWEWLLLEFLLTLLNRAGPLKLLSGFVLNWSYSLLALLLYPRENSQEYFLGICGNSRESVTGIFGENADSYSKEIFRNPFRGISRNRRNSCRHFTLWIPD